MSKPTKSTKQLTFDSLPPATTKQDIKATPTRQKQIHITQMETRIGIDELTLEISFRLEPSYRAFSKVKADLFFGDTSISSVFICILQGPLGRDELEYSWVLNTKGIAEGTYHLKVEMYEAWSPNEKLYQTIREITVDYIPQTRQSRLIKIPFVKKVTGAELAVISDQEKQLYKDMENTIKREQLSQRDE